MADGGTLQPGRAERVIYAPSDVAGRLSTAPFIKKGRLRSVCGYELLLSGVTCFGLASLASEVPGITDRVPGGAVTVEFLQHQAKPGVPERMADVASELESYRDLEVGWDGPESIGPPSAAIDDAIAFLVALPPTAPEPEATISADGQVGLYWDLDGQLASVNFHGAGKVSYYGDIDGVVARGNLTGARGMVPADLLSLIVDA